MDLNLYYLVSANKVAESARYARLEGLPNQCLQVAYSPRLTKAIVQAEWMDVEAMDAIGTRLGALLPSGFAEQAVYDYLSSDEWLLS